MKPGFYLTELLPTTAADCSSCWLVFEWTARDTKQVKALRRTMKTLPKRYGQWWTAHVGPGPTRALALTELPETVEKKWDKSKNGVVQLSRKEALSLFEAAHEDNLYKMDAKHLAISDMSLYIGMYGKYGGEAFETRSLEGD